MLDQLQIQNLALIDENTLSFTKGLNIISGETGSGKSILIKAVNLLLGEKPSADTIRQGAEEATVEALFSISSNHPLKKIIESLGIPEDNQILIKRVIQRGGKTRTWINGHLANQTVLNQIGRWLISISNQHEHQSLLNPFHHLYLLDRFGGLLSLREDLQEKFAILETHIKELKWLKEKGEKRKIDEDLWLFQAQEIQQAHLRPGEDRELQQKKQVLFQAEKLWEKIHQTLQLLSEDEYACQNTLSKSKDLIKWVAQVDPDLQPVFQELETMQLHLTEITTQLNSYLGQLVFDPQALEGVEERIQFIQRLTSKYGSTVDEVLSYLSKTENNLKEGEDQSYSQMELERTINEARNQILVFSTDLSEKRKKAAQDLSRRIKDELKELGMSGCDFEVVFTPSLPEKGLNENLIQEGFLLTPFGIERGEFYIAPNIGEGLRPMARIASGGELSRILLVLQEILSGQDSVETLVFDEVDSGIGGSLGEAVGRKLRQLARTHQILCVTHLPQIAAFSETHYLVSKKTSQQRTLSQIRLLQGDQKVEELARMIGGHSPSHQTLPLAKEMFRRAQGPLD